jgi:hypothetical protein
MGYSLDVLYSQLADDFKVKKIIQYGGTTDIHPADDRIASLFIIIALAEKSPE